jgi:hypothetical protein
MILLLLLTFFAQDRPVAVAKFCGNTVIHSKHRQEAFERIQSEGCENIQFIHIEGDYFLAYGTKILVAESVPEGF